MSLTTAQGKLLLLSGTLLVAFVSFRLFSPRWYGWMVEGRTFPVWWSVLPTEYFVQSIPFTWPFALAGFLLGPSLAPRRASPVWLLIFAAVGAILYGTLTEDVFTEMQGVLSSHFQQIYIRACMPLLFELLGLLVARVRLEV